MPYSRRCMYCRPRSDLLGSYAIKFVAAGAAVTAITVIICLLGHVAPQDAALIIGVAVGLFAAGAALFVDMNREDRDAERQRYRSGYVPGPDKWGVAETVKWKITGIIKREDKK